MRSRDGSNDSEGHTDGARTPTSLIDEMDRTKALHILDLDASATAHDVQMKFNQAMGELSEHPSDSAVERAIAMARAVSYMIDEDPALEVFSEKYAAFSSSLKQAVTKYPQFETKINRFSEELYTLCSQCLMNIKSPDADREILKNKFETDIENLILSVNAAFRNATDNVNAAFGDVTADQEYSDTDQAWNDMIHIVEDDIYKIVLYVTDFLQPTPLDVFQGAYNTFIENINVEVEVPEHKEIINSLIQRVSEIGNAYFSGLKDEKANVADLSKVYQKSLNAALTEIGEDLQAAGSEQAEIWPQLNLVLKVLATIVYVVRWSILSEDAKISRSNKYFKAEKKAIKEKLNDWLQEIPMLDQEKHAEYNARFSR